MKKKEKKDVFNAKLAFIISLFSILPLLNFGICVVSIYMSLRALKDIYSDMEKYGGLVYAYLALGISSAMLIVSILFMIVYFQRKLTCEVALNSNIF